MLHPLTHDGGAEGGWRHIPEALCDELRELKERAKRSGSAWNVSEMLDVTGRLCEADAALLKERRAQLDEADEKLAGKSDTGHRHNAGDIASGTLDIGRGGTGNTGTGSTTTIQSIATAAADCEITTAQYAYWGKAAMVRLVVKKTGAVTSGTTTLCTLAAGKRPKYTAPAQWRWNNGGQITTAGAVQVNGAIPANTSITIYATYILA